MNPFWPSIFSTAVLENTRPSSRVAVVATSGEICFRNNTQTHRCSPYIAGTLKRALLSQCPLQGGNFVTKSIMNPFWPSIFSTAVLENTRPSSRVAVVATSGEICFRNNTQTHRCSPYIAGTLKRALLSQCPLQGGNFVTK
eukprot:sb/3474216/